MSGKPFLPLQKDDYNDEENSDDLEKTLVLAAADADARNYYDTQPDMYVGISEENSKTEDASKPAKSETKVRKYGEEHISPYGPTSLATIEVNSEHQSSKCGAKRKSDHDQPISYKEHDSQGSSKVKEEYRIPKCATKRKTENDEIISPNKQSRSNEGYANVVATHYNSLEEKGLDERSKSRIVYMRNFHNWIKSMLINEYLTKIKERKKYNAPIMVHDMCCGKGGDLLKWKKGGITHLICSDIAAISLDQCKARYSDMKTRSARERGGGNIYSIECIPGDCTRIRLREKYSDPSRKLDLVSCQFAFHYSFESLPQAECMLRNAAECLQPGGYFIGTIPDANDLIGRGKKSNATTFGNNVFQVSFEFNINHPDLFGAKYNFHLDGVVNCPEFLVHFPTLVKLARKFGLKLVNKEKFYDFFERMKYEGKQLLSNMSSLEAYPPHETAKLAGSDDDYGHAVEFLAKNPVAKIGTLSKSEWEASSLYMLFAFEKVKNTWNRDGTPLYEFDD